MAFENRLHKLEEKVNKIIGGIIVVGALSAMVFAIAHVTFEKKDKLEQDFLNLVEKHGLKGPPGAPGRDGISVPIGGIVAWAAPLPVAGDSWYDQWRVCDGDEILLTDVSKEFSQIISDDFGKAKPGYIKLPNFSGYFLRGFDNTGKIDPNRKGGKVGSIQDDAFEKHAHGIQGRKSNKANGGTYGIHVFYEGIGVTTEPKGGDETRPKNIAVYWIIRIR